MSKNARITISVIFIIFAVIQWNDPDPHIWIPIYLLVAFAPWAKSLGKWKNTFLTVLLLGLGLWFGTYLDDLYRWGAAGFPSVTGSMVAENESVELVREAGGLLISLFTVFYVTQKDK